MRRSCFGHCPDQRLIWRLYEPFVVNRPCWSCSITRLIASTRLLATDLMAGPPRGPLERVRRRWRPRECASVALGIVPTDVGSGGCTYEPFVVKRPWWWCSPSTSTRCLPTDSMAGPARGGRKRLRFRWRPREGLQWMFAGASPRERPRGLRLGSRAIVMCMCKYQITMYASDCLTGMMHEDILQRREVIY